MYGVGTEAEWDQVADGILRECPAGDTRAQPSAAEVGVALRGYPREASWVLGFALHYLDPNRSIRSGAKVSRVDFGKRRCDLRDIAKCRLVGL